jgi:hypothetical protein
MAFGVYAAYLRKVWSTMIEVTRWEFRNFLVGQTSVYQISIDINFLRTLTAAEYPYAELLAFILFYGCLCVRTTMVSTIFIGCLRQLESRL